MTKQKQMKISETTNSSKVSKKHREVFKRISKNTFRK